MDLGWPRSNPSAPASKITDHERPMSSPPRPKLDYGKRGTADVTTITKVRPRPTGDHISERRGPHRLPSGNFFLGARKPEVHACRSVQARIALSGAVAVGLGFTILRT